MFNDKRRGDVYWMTDTSAREGNTHVLRGNTHVLRGDRPAVIVSSDEVNQTSPTVTVIPLTTSTAKLERGEGYCNNVLLMSLNLPSVAVTRQVRTIDADDLQRYLGHLPDREMARLDAALRRVMGP